MHTHMPWATTISISRYDSGHVYLYREFIFEWGLCTSNHPTSLAGVIMVNVIETGFLSNAEYFDHYSNQSFVVGRHTNGYQYFTGVQ